MSVAAPQASLNSASYPALAEQAMAAHHPQLALEFHPAAVAAIDAFLDLSWGEEGAMPKDDAWEPSPASRAAIVNLGIFFGELLRREFGGSWQDDPTRSGNIFMARVVLRGGVLVLPLNRIFKRLKNGAVDRVEPLYQQVRELCRAESSPAEADGWVRQASHFERIGRADLARAFYERALELGLPHDAQRKIETLAARAARVAEAKARLLGRAARGRGALESFGVRTDLRSLTLVGLDVFLDETFGSAPLRGAKRRAAAELEHAIGAFVGELLRERFGGVWKEDAVQPPEQWTVNWAGRVVASPFTLVAKRLDTGRGLSVLEQVSPIVSRLVRNGLAEDPPEEPSEWQAQAERFADKVQRFDLANRFGNTALDLGGDRPSLRLGLARWCRKLDRPDEALEHLEAGLRLDPSNEALLLEHLSLVPEDVGPEAALAAFEAGLEIDPGAAPALLGKGRALLDLERFADAAAWLDSLALREDCEPERSVLAARAHLRTGELAKSHELSERLLALPELDASWRAEAEARLAALAADPDVMVAAAERIADAEPAAEAFGRLTVLFPTLAKAWRERGVRLARLGRTDEALPCLVRATELEPTDPENYEQEAIALARAERYVEAIVVLDRGLERCPYSGALLARRGSLLTTLGLTGEASRMFEAAFEFDPAHHDTWAWKGALEKKRGSTQEAIASLKRYLASKAGSPEERVLVARRQLWALEHPGEAQDAQKSKVDHAEAFARTQAGDLAAALVAFDHAVGADALNGDAWFNRGTCLVHLGQVEEALASYGRAEEILGATAGMAQALVACLSRLGRDGDAPAVYDRALERSPRDADLLLGKARALARLSRWDASLAVYADLLAGSPADEALLDERARVHRASRLSARG